MKLILHALCASLIIAPLTYAGPSNKLTDNSTAAACDKCKKDGDADKDKQPDAKLAGCDKCKKDGDADKDKQPDGSRA